MKKPCLFILSMILLHLSISAQTPQWKWAKGVGGNHSDINFETDNGNTIHIDGVGNTYQLISSQSGSIKLGVTTFINNAGGTGKNTFYFVKYNTLGSIVWAKQFSKNYAGGINYANSMFTRSDGHSFLHIPMYTDSIIIGGVVVKNSLINGTRRGYCIAQYDSNGNVVSAHAYSSPTAGFVNIQSFYNGQILATGQCYNTPDTINGIVVDPGSFLAILDSTGNTQSVKNLGYVVQTVTSKFPILVSPITQSNKSVYVNIRLNVSTFLNQSAIPASAIPANPINLLVKFDSLLNYQWSKMTSPNMGAIIASDQHDNVYLSVKALSTIPEDTLVIDTTRVILPFYSPIGQYDFLGVVKIDGAGLYQWLDTTINVSVPYQYLSCIITDMFDNVYVTGRYMAQLIAYPDTLNGYGNIFLIKVGKDGHTRWAQNTQNTLGYAIANGLAEDGKGNVFLNGGHGYNILARPYFGTDSLVCATPVASSPLAPDIFTARLGNCNMPKPTVTGATVLCAGDSVTLTCTPAASTYLWSTGDTSRSIVVKTGGSYSVYAVDTLGCYAQSLPKTLTVTPLSYKSLTRAICTGDSIVVGIHHYKANGAYHDTLTASTGCDSIVTLALTVYPKRYTAVTDSFCQSAGYVFGGVTRSTAGTYYDTLTASTGCDSIVTLTLTLRAKKYTAITDSFCAGGSYTLHGTIYTVAGTYTDTLQTVKGCDSIVTLTLSTTSGFKQSITTGICQGGSYNLHGKTLTTAGVYKDTVKTLQGCDSVITLTLLVYPNYTAARYDTICAGASYTFYGKTLTAAGIYPDTLKTSKGCDSIIVLHLAIRALPVVTWLQSDTTWCSNISHTHKLSGSSPSGGIYSGTYVMGDSIKLPSNQDSATFTVTYTYMDSKGCSSSAKHLFHASKCLGIADLGATGILVYPNPNSGKFTITVSTIHSAGMVSVYDITGKKITDKILLSGQNHFDLKLPTGIYQLHIVVDGQEQNEKMVITE
jgi:Secretion system C-terminal sorting domain